MSKKNFKFKIKGHGSFYLREGWLRKGIKNVEKDENIFINKEATDILGVGNNMVKSIRYWLQACGLTEEKKRKQYLTEDFGEIINKFDPYFEDIFTLWLIHYKLSSNSELATTWYLFFNKLNLDEFTKVDLFHAMKNSLDGLTDKKYSENSLNDDCSCFIKTYYTENPNSKNPEENTVCPLSELKLIDKIKSADGKDIYIKKRPNMEVLDKLVVMYIILDNLDGKNSIEIEKLLNDSSNVGKILNLDRNILNEYLDILKYEGFIDINRTAGLDKIYIKHKDKNKIIEEYFKE
ncbi:DUF4007 family protein [Clostridium cochlearium]|uniref:DUF4007 family protein n=1 Tax=Clostridium cochlearium TaxID=1494 RepID=A0A1G9HEW2_CLOCO|nr:DUF4007 family protein [Clostridium cochlearium]MBE6063817.1 DUF4007 family protein [Clostridium cochlearium]MBU5269224.1 DUF4007 family protein [Clostridium cochlearium]NOH15411.1 DUF4007 family protein [Clostridium cochlearium]SDL11244.1 Protein of unknown function [Clostridium cochlearium]